MPDAICSEGAAGRTSLYVKSIATVANTDPEPWDGHCGLETVPSQLPLALVSTPLLELDIAAFLYLFNTWTPFESSHVGFVQPFSISCSPHSSTLSILKSSLLSHSLSLEPIAPALSFVCFQGKSLSPCATTLRLRKVSMWRKDCKAQA